MKIIKIITKIPKGYTWTHTTKLSANRLENTFALIVPRTRKNMMKK